MFILFKQIGAISSSEYFLVFILLEFSGAFPSVENTHLYVFYRS